MCECFACMSDKCTAYLLGTQDGQKKVLDPLELELWMVINCHLCKNIQCS